MRKKIPSHVWDDTSGLWAFDTHPTRKQLDLIETLLHCGAYTRTGRAEIKRTIPLLTKETASALISQMLKRQREYQQDLYAYGKDYDTRYDDEDYDYDGQFELAFEDTL